MFKKLVVGTLLGICLLSFSGIVQSEGTVYVGSKNSTKYHYTWCKWAMKINPQNKVVFNSPEEAIKAGYVPCKVCRPPTKSEQGDQKQ